MGILFQNTVTQTISLSHDPFYHQFFEHTRVGLFRSTVDGRFAFANSAFATILGYNTVEEVLALRIPEDIYADPTQRMRIRQQYEPRGVMGGVELTFKRKDGSPVVITVFSRTTHNETGQITGYEGLVLDITPHKRTEDQLRQLTVNLAQRNNELVDLHDELAQSLTETRRAETALRASEERYRSLAENSHAGIWQLDLLGNIVYANSQMLEWLEADDLTELLAVPYYRFLDMEGGEVIRREQQRKLGGKITSYEVEIVGLKGARRTLILSGAPLRDHKNNVQGTIGTCVDITERKKAEEALRQTQKLESLGILAGGIAHDFNNLLVALLGQTSLALSKLTAENPAYIHIEKSITAANRAALLTRQLLAYSGRGQFQVQSVNLNELVQENLDLLAVAIPKHISIYSQLFHSLRPIEADVSQIQQIVMNLILNAADAIGDQPGTITISTKMEYIYLEDDRYSLYTQMPLSVGPYVSLEIKDTGSGMNAHILSKIFDPFFSTKGTGRGLGLAAVLGIVRGHKGGIAVQSQVNNGTHFKLLFPAIPSPLMAEDPTHFYENVVSQKGIVLVVDDEEAVLEVVTDILEMEGWQVITAVDGQKAVELYRIHRPQIQLVLLDLSMPGVKGDEIFQQLRQFDAQARVIISSGYNEKETIQQFVGQNLTGFLQKPYSAQKLIETINYHIGE